MKTIELVQGSPAWHAHRAKHFNASDAPAMMGESRYETRTELVKRLATGIGKEIDAATQKRFDDGHAAEAKARPYAESIVGETLYPIVGSEIVDDLPLSASFDGITMLHDVCFEHKSVNDGIRVSLDGNSDGANLPAMYRIQMEQQLMLSGAEKCIFMATAWDGDELLEQHFAWYLPDMELRARIIAGWKQLAEDLADYQHVEAKPEAVAEHIEALPALLVQVEGRVLATNLDKFKEAATAFIANINTDLQTDDHFVNADKMVKFLADGEKQLAQVKQHAQAQAADIDAVFRAIDDISAQMREKRLALDKLVKAEKENRKAEIVRGAQDAMIAHIDKLNSRVHGFMPRTIAPFAEAIKGLKSLSSMQDAVNTALANAKIEANEIADRIEQNLKDMTACFGVDDYRFLFPDLAQIVLKASDDFAAVVTMRVNEHKAKEAAKLEAEREKIRQEETEKAVREAARPAYIPPVGQAGTPAGPGTSTPASEGGSPPAYAVRKQHTDLKTSIEVFFASVGTPPAKQANYRAVIMAWEEFKARNDMEAARRRERTSPGGCRDEQ